MVEDITTSVFMYRDESTEDSARQLPGCRAEHTLMKRLTWRPLLFWANPDGLDVHKFANTEGGEFAPIATIFDAAKGQARIAGGHTLD